MENELFLTDKEYLKLLKRGFKNLNKITNINFYNSNEIGNKYVTSNVGLCNNELCTKKLALFPKIWPKRKNIKYRKETHRCPLEETLFSEGYGCFYRCLLFKNKIENIEEIKKLYKIQINIFEKTMKNENLL